MKKPKRKKTEKITSGPIKPNRSKFMGLLKKKFREIEHLNNEIKRLKLKIVEKDKMLKFYEKGL